MKPEDEQDINKDTGIDRTSNSLPITNNDDSSEFFEEINAIESSQVEDINTPIQSDSIPLNQPITPAVSLNIYPDPSNPDQLRPAPNTLTVQPMEPAKSKKGLIIGLIIASILVFLGGGSVAGYTFWYSNPDKVISDAIVNTITAKTSIYTGNVNFDSNTLKVKFDIGTKKSGTTGSLDTSVVIDFSGKSYTASGSGLIDNAGDLYFKVDVTKIAASIRSDYEARSSKEMIVAYDKLVAKLNNKWIKVSSSDLAQFNQSYSNSKDCINDTIKKYSEDKAAIAEITDLYSKQNFIVVDKDLGQKDKSVGYQVKTDKTKLTEFTKGLKDTKIYKSINKCDDSISVDDILKSYDNVSSKDTDNTTIKLWIDSWTHQMTSISLNTEDSGTKVSSEFVTKFNQDIDIVAPTDSINLSELKKEFDNFSRTMVDSLRLAD